MTNKSIKIQVIYKDPQSLTANQLNQLTYGSAENEAYQAMLENVKTNGILQPLVITENDYVRSGNLRLQVALALGLDIVPCIVEADSEEVNNVLEVPNSKEIVDNFKTASHNIKRTETPYSILRRAMQLEEYAGIKQGVRSDKDSEMKAVVAERQKLVSDSMLNKLKATEKNLKIIYQDSPKERTAYWNKVGKAISVNGAYKETTKLAMQCEEPMSMKDPYSFITDQIKIYNQSCFDTSHIPDASVAAIVTSPPYYKMRNQGMVDEIGQEETVDLYIQNLVTLFSTNKRILKSDGCIWVNLGDYVKDGQYSLVPERLMIKMVEAGFLVNDIVHWVKTTAQYCDGNRSTRNFEHLIQFTLDKNYYNDQTWLNNAEGFEDNKFGDGTRIKLSAFLNLKDGIVKTSSANTLRLKEACKNEQFFLDHSSTYPVEIPFLCIKNSSREGDTIVDLFNGCGTSAKACLETNRNYIGFEVNPLYVRASKVNIELDFGAVATEKIAA